MTFYFKIVLKELLPMLLDVGFRTSNPLDSPWKEDLRPQNMVFTNSEHYNLTQ